MNGAHGVDVHILSVKLFPGAPGGKARPIVPGWCTKKKQKKKTKQKTYLGSRLTTRHAQKPVDLQSTVASMVFCNILEGKWRLCVGFARANCNGVVPLRAFIFFVRVVFRMGCCCRDSPASLHTSSISIFVKIPHQYYFFHPFSLFSPEGRSERCLTPA